MSEAELAAALRRLRQVVSATNAKVAEGPVSEPRAVHEVRSRIGALFDLSRPTSVDELVTRVIERLKAETVQVTHPRYFGLFNPAVPAITVVADALVALFNPQLAAWDHSPAAQEIERLVLVALGRLFDLDLDGGMAHFTSGGAEANGTATLAALVAAFPSLPKTGLRALPAQPTLYLSTQGHDSFPKIAVACGLGRNAVRRVPVDDDFRMDVSALREQLRRDRARGEHPFLVVATAGTTSTGVIDPLESIAEIAREEHLWMHADAAWGGGALLSERLRPVLAGIESADSMTWDAHKWLSVPMAAGMFFSRRPAAVRAAFEVDATYIPPSPEGADDPYMVSWQWSRRFIGLKVFMALAEVGLQGYGERVDHQAEMGQRLRERLQESGWLLCNRTPLPLVCFSHPRIESGLVTASEVVARVVASGQAWASTVRLPSGAEVVRACICNYRTSSADIDATVVAFDRALTEISDEPATPGDESVRLPSKDTGH